MKDLMGMRWLDGLVKRHGRYPFYSTFWPWAYRDTQTPDRIVRTWRGPVADTRRLLGAVV